MAEAPKNLTGSGSRQGLFALALMGFLWTGDPSQADGGGSRLGTKVVLKSWKTPLRLESKASATPLPLWVYRVERVEGNWLWLVAPCLRGWVQADEVVPLDQAIDYFSAEIQAHPSEYMLYLRRGFLRSEQKEFAGAEADFNEAIRLAPHYSGCYLYRGRMWYSRKDYTHALADFDEAIRINPTYANAYDARAYVHLDRKDFVQALGDSEQVIRHGSGIASNYLTRSLVRYWTKDYDRALTDLNEAIRLDPEYADAFRIRGFVRLMKNELDLAIADCDEAIRLDPEDPDARNNRGRARLSKKQYLSAIADLDEAIRLNPRHARAFQNRAEAWEAENRSDLAIADDAEVLKIESDNLVALSRHAWHLATLPDANLRDGQKAVAEATRACELEQWKCPGCLETLAAAKAEVGDFDEAVRLEEKAIGLRVNDPSGKAQGEVWLALYRSKKPFREAEKS